MAQETIDSIVDPKVNLRYKWALMKKDKIERKNLLNPNYWLRKKLHTQKISRIHNGYRVDKAARPVLLTEGSGLYNDNQLENEVNPPENVSREDLGNNITYLDSLKNEFGLSVHEEIIREMLYLSSTEGFKRFLNTISRDGLIRYDEANLGDPFYQEMNPLQANGISIVTQEQLFSPLD